MRSRAIEDYKKTLHLSDIQREVLVGTLLGDGCLETINSGRTYRLKIEHYLKQKEYLNWKYEIFKPWVLTPPRIRRKLSYGAERDYYSLSTLSHSAFRFYGQQFYGSGKKSIPKVIHKLLTPLALAVWFMDDGSIKSNHHKALVIHAQSFSQDDLQKMINVLEKKFGVKAKLRKRRDGSGFVLYILSETIEKFVKLVKPYILPSLSYKLGNNLPKE